MNKRIKKKLLKLKQLLAKIRNKFQFSKDNMKGFRKKKEKSKGNKPLVNQNSNIYSNKKIPSKTK